MIILSISEAFDIAIPHLDKLLLRLYNVISLGSKLTITPYAIYPNRKIFLLFSESLKSSILSEAKRLYIENIPGDYHRNEAYFYEFLYLLVTHWPDFYQKINQQVPPCEVGLFFNSDVEHMYYTKSKLEFSFGKKINVTVIQSESLTSLPDKSQGFDLLIINFILSPKVELPVPYISVVDALWEDKNRQIQQIVDKIYYQKMKSYRTISK